MVGSETSFIGAYNNTSLSKTGTLIGNNENQILINNDTENPAVELYKNNPSVTREQGNLLIRKVASPIKAYDAINAITAYHQNEWWPQSIYGIDTTFPNKPTQVVQKPFDMNVGTAKYHIASYYWSIGLDRPATDPSFKLNPSGVILKDLPFYNSSMDLNEFAYAVTITPTQDWRNQANTYCPPVTGVFTCADVDLTGDKFIYTPVHSIIYENGAWNVKELLWVGFANGYGSEGPAFWHDWVYHPLPLEPITNQGPLALIDVYLIMNDHLL